MIKIVATCKLDNKTRTKSFQSSQNKYITTKDIERLYYFTEDMLTNYYGAKVTVSYKVTYEHQPFAVNISAISGKHYINSTKSLANIMTSLIREINNAVKSGER